MNLLLFPSVLFIEKKLINIQYVQSYIPNFTAIKSLSYISKLQYNLYCMLIVQSLTYLFLKFTKDIKKKNAETNF